MSFQGYLRQSTAETVLMGPFVDSGDGDAEEGALTITSGEVRISKNSANIIPKSETTSLVHDEIGFYTCLLNTTDTDTVGRLRIMVHESGALLVDQTYWILEEAVFDAIFAASATGPLLASVGGTLADAASAGDVDTSTTLMSYLKQLLNELSGSVGIGTMPTLLDPANGVNMFEMLRAGLGATFASATDSLEQLQADIVTAQADLDDIQARLPATLSGGRIRADAEAISGDVVTADNLQRLVGEAILVAQVNDASATVTAFAADQFTEISDDHFNGRLITFATGNLVNQQTDITGYDAAGGPQGAQEFTVTALTEAPADGDWFVVH